MANRATGSEAGGAARHTLNEAESWVEPLARFGYGAKGFVYLLVGGLAFVAAIGAGGETTGSSGALASIADSTAGRVLLALVAAGLFGYAVWGAVRAVHNPENDSGGKRAYHGLGAVLYAILALEAARLALSGGGATGGGSSASHWSATLMQQPFGPWLLGLAGVGIAFLGLQQLISAWRVDLDDQLTLGSMSPGARPWAVRAGRFGLAARGVVFGIIGGYVVVAAIQSDPSEARGLEGVLESLEQTPWLLAVLALGLVAYGIHCIVLAGYRRFQT